MWSIWETVKAWGQEALDVTLGRYFIKHVVPAQEYSRSEIDWKNRTARIFKENIFGQESCHKERAFGPMNAQPIEIRSEGREPLDGVLIKPRDGSSCREIIICFRGNSGAYETQFDNMQTFADRFKVAVLGFNYRGVCNSGGRAYHTDELQDDGLAVFHFAVMTLGYSPSRCILLGASLGGGIATCLAAKLHAQGEAVFLFVDRSFMSITEVVIGRLSRSFGKVSDVIRMPLNGLLKFFALQIDTLKAWKTIPSSHRAYVTLQGHRPYATVSYRKQLSLVSLEALQKIVHRVRQHGFDDPVITRNGSLHEGLEPRRREKVAATLAKKRLHAPNSFRYETALNDIRRRYLAHTLFYPKTDFDFKYDSKKLAACLRQLELPSDSDTILALEVKIREHLRSHLRRDETVGEIEHILASFFEEYFPNHALPQSKITTLTEALSNLVQVDIDYRQSHSVSISELVSRHDEGVTGLDFLGALVERARKVP